MIICYPVPEITTCDECNFYFSFWPFFCPFTPRPPSPHYRSKELKFNKMKKRLYISSFCTCVPKILITCLVPEIWCATDGQSDEQMNRQKKWHIEVGAPPKNQSQMFCSHNCWQILSTSSQTIYPKHQSVLLKLIKMTFSTTAKYIKKVKERIHSCLYTHFLLIYTHTWCPIIKKLPKLWYFDT